MSSALLLVALLGIGTPVHAEPRVPADPAEVLERLPRRAGDPAERELARLRAAVSAQPDDLDAALAYAQAEIARGRADADPRRYGYAQAALRPWWQDPPPEVRVLRATLAQNRHDFEAALADLDAVLAQAPRNAQARLSKAVIEMVRGEPDRAADSCAALVRSVDRRAALPCSAAAAALAGRAPEAVRVLAALLERPQALDPALAAWSATVLAEAAAQLDLPQTEAYFGQALALAPGDAYLLGAWTDWLLERGRAGEVVGLLATRTAVDALLLRLALAERRLGLPAAGAHAALLEARFAEAEAGGERLHDALRARWLLATGGDPAQALALAERNWERQREPADARILLAAAQAAARPAAARPALDWMQRTGIQDVRLSALAAALPERRS